MNDIIHIPLRDKTKKIIAYTIVDKDVYETIKKYSICAYNQKKTNICTYKY